MIFKGAISEQHKGVIWDRLAWGVILFFVILSFLANLISNEKPLYIHDGSDAYFPFLSHVNWEKICQDRTCKKITSPIPFSPQTIDVSSIFISPGAKSKSKEAGRHFLGTDQLGRDVLSILIHGSRTAVWVSMLAAGLAFVIGLFYGLSIGYFGNDKIRYSVRKLLMMIGMILFVAYVMIFITYAWQAQVLSKGIASIFLLFIIGLFVFLLRFLSIREVNGKTKYVQLDTIGMRFVDIMKALPPLFIVLFALQLQESASMWYIIGLIAFLLWAGFARHSRAEILRLRNSPSIQSALLTGKSDFWIWRYEIIPFIVRPLLVILAFSMASAILLEATLSFLGLGLPAEHVSWGTLIDAARSRSNAWWLLVFPGLCMLSLIWSLQHLGRRLEERLRSRQSLRSVD